jgi:hypothetical protein
MLYGIGDINFAAVNPCLGFSQFLNVGRGRNQWLRWRFIGFFHESNLTLIS